MYSEAFQYLKVELGEYRGSSDKFDSLGQQEIADEFTTAKQYPIKAFMKYGLGSYGSNERDSYWGVAEGSSAYRQLATEKEIRKEMHAEFEELAKHVLRQKE